MILLVYLTREISLLVDTWSSKRQMKLARSDLKIVRLYSSENLMFCIGSIINEKLYSSIQYLDSTLIKCELWDEEEY
jgi:hypothetical protein